MAQADDRIDPADLERIDALLDEVDPDVVVTDENLADELADLLPETGLEPPELEPEPIADDDYREPAAEMDERGSEEFWERQSQAFVNNNELTVEEMDTLKNLIITFGAILVVLALIAIGIISWAAFGSSGNDQNAQLLEDVIGESELARSTSQANAAALKDLDRKMDALSFQIDGISSDLYAAKPGQIGLNPMNPMDLNSAEQPNGSTNNQKNGEQISVNQQPNQGVQELQPGLVGQQSTVAVDTSKLEAKVDEVSRSLGLAQRRVVEINNRVKSLQEQYATLVKSVKQVEKGWLEQKLEQEKQAQAQLEAKEAAESEVKKPAKSYQYQAPNTFNYETSHEGTSYP